MKHRMHAATLTCACVVLVAQFTAAQDGGRSDNDQPVDETLTFEVASIRANELGAQSLLRAFRNGRYIARYVTVKELIRSAYGKPEQMLTTRQVVGGPSWLDEERFDIEATAPGVPESPRGSFTAPVLTMLRKLLEDRFSLKTHFETREFPLYALILARHDGTLGPGLKRRTEDCTAPPVGVAPGPGQCGGRVNPGVLTGTGLTMANLVSALSQLVPNMDRAVVDRTGLTGTFDVEMRWMPEAPVAIGGRGSAAPAADSNLPSIFTALEEQLGLKLQPTTGPLDVLVIEDVRRPSPN